MLLWLWCRPAAAALIQLLAWELPYVPDTALKKERKKKRSNLRLKKAFFERTVHRKLIESYFNDQGEKA